MVLIIVCLLALVIIVVYDLVVYDITDKPSELCAKYGFLVSPGC